MSAQVTEVNGRSPYAEVSVLKSQVLKSFVKFFFIFPHFTEFQQQKNRIKYSHHQAIL